MLRLHSQRDANAGSCQSGHWLRSSPSLCQFDRSINLLSRILQETNLVDQSRLCRHSVAADRLVPLLLLLDCTHDHFTMYDCSVFSVHGCDVVRLGLGSDVIMEISVALDHFGFYQSSQI